MASATLFYSIMRNYKRSLFFSVIIYSIGVVIGLFIHNDTGSSSLIDGRYSHIEEIFDRSQHELCILIIRNNLSLIITNLLGALTFGILSITSTFYNGLVFGIVLSFSVKEYGVTVLLRNVLPHSIEIVGIIISCSLSICIMTDLLIYLRTGYFDLKEKLKFYTPKTVFCFLITIGAAIIEAFISIS